MLDGIDKKTLVAAIVAELRAELDAVKASASAAREGATHEDAKPENQYDTRALEASYLAGAQTARAEALESAIHTLESMELRTFDEDKPIALTALVEVEHDDGTDVYFLCPYGGGVKVSVDDRLVRVLTPESPLGKKLSKKRVGDGFELKIKGKARDYDIVEVQ